MQINWGKFESCVQNLIEKEHIVGTAVAVSHKGKTIYQKGFGFSDLQTKSPVTENTIFGVASVTKSFTAKAIMKLEAEGKLSIEDSVIKHLPEFNIQGMKDLEQVKIKHLLSHTTGVPPIKRKEEVNFLDQHLEYLATYQTKLLGAPGEYYSYCNDTFLLLGAIIERTTDRLYRRYITEEILNPLKMYRSTYSIEEVLKMEDVSVPYDYNRKKCIHERQEWPKLGNYEVGGGIRSSVIDLLKYGNDYINNKDLYTRMWTPFIETGSNSYYGYGFQVTPEYNGITLVEHGGGQPGVSSNFGFVPEKDIVIAVLTNVSGVPVSDIWLKAVNTIVDLPIETKRVELPEYKLHQEDLEKLLGVYESDEGSLIEVFLDQEIPKVNLLDETYNLRATSTDTLVIEKSDVPIHFYIKENESSAWAVFFGSRMLFKKDMK
jgi:CubicO group peptidase (beta-lactamase class C family)